VPGGKPRPGKAFSLEGYPPEKPVVESAEWDGSDWFICGGVPFVSDRAKKWLEHVFANPIETKAAFLNLANSGV
jgi:hypothetical protein